MEEKKHKQEEADKYQAEEYFDRSGCYPLALTFLCIVVFLVVVGCIYLFT